MRKWGIFLLAFTLVLALGVTNQTASAGSCPSAKNGKCPTQKKITRKRSDYSAEQRAKMLEEARKVCVKRYGAGARVHKLDYAKWMIICNEPGY
jgi:ribosomal protein L20